MWKEIKNYENYEINENGIVRSKRTKKPMSTFSNKNFYVRVNLSVKGKKVKPLVHVLVANTFVDNPYQLKEVDHINDQRDDNRSCNLRFVTHSENVKKSWINRRRNMLKGEQL